MRTGRPDDDRSHAAGSGRDQPAPPGGPHQGDDARHGGGRPRAAGHGDRPDQGLCDPTARAGPGDRLRHGGLIRMADQATVNRGNGVPINAPATAVVSNLAEFGNDFATLAELQAKLASIDLKESAGRAAVPAGLLAGALVLLLGSVPVLLAGVAELIVRYTSIDHHWALLLTAGGAIVLTVVVGALAVSRLRKSFESFQRSREELARNISWI